MMSFRKFSPKHRRFLPRTVNFDGCPVPRGLALALYEARKRGWKGTVQSCDRRRGVPEKLGKKSQWQLFQGWIKRLPGYNPANPPGRSTHERRSDGVAYKGPIGRRLRWWQTGIDISDSDTALRLLRNLGFEVKKPYHSASEAHHINFYKSPSKRLRQLWRKQKRRR